MLMTASAKMLLRVDGLDAEGNEHARPETYEAHEEAEEPRTTAHVIFNMGVSAVAAVVASDEGGVVGPVFRVAVLVIKIGREYPRLWSSGGLVRVV